MKFPLTFLFAFFSLTIFAQTASIEGIAYDKTANLPLQSASVALYALPDSSLVDGLVTGTAGTFKFSKLKAVNYFLKILFVGYNTYSSSAIGLNSGQSLNIGKQGVSVNEQFLTEVKVTGQQLQNINRIDKQVYKANQFEAAKGGTA